MPKIKDLVTVITDNAFLLFPVDVERYELYDTIVRMETCYYCGLPFWLSDEDSRVQEFIRDSMAKFLVGAASSRIVCDSDPEISLGANIRDKALRFNASLFQNDLCAFESGSLHEDLLNVHLGFEALLRTMRKTPGFLSVVPVDAQGV